MPKRAMGRERRIFDGQVELRSRGNRKVIEGHALVYGRYSQDLGGFVEQFHPGAASKTIRENDIRALHNHDPNRVLGRNRSGTLRLSQDASGLYYAIDPPDTTYANDLVAVMERGDVNQSSCQFTKVKEEWGRTERSYPLRGLLEVIIHDVSVVTEPAYEMADAAVTMRSALQGLATRAMTTAEHDAVLNGDLDAIKAVLDRDENDPPAEPEERSTQRTTEMDALVRRLYRDEADALAALEAMRQ